MDGIWQKLEIQNGTRFYKKTDSFESWYVGFHRMEMKILLIENPRWPLVAI